MNKYLMILLTIEQLQASSPWEEAASFAAAATSHGRSQPRRIDTEGRTSQGRRHAQFFSLEGAGAVGAVGAISVVLPLLVGGVYK